MKRRWFRDKDGTYYRNVPLISAERFTLINRCLPWRQLILGREWRRAWSEGVIRTRRIGWRDEVTAPRPFREAYPDHPGLWTLDEVAAGAETRRRDLRQ